MRSQWKFGEKEAWIRFGVGLGGLALSFFAALFSTALRQSGYFVLAAAVASLALLFAGTVGLYTVPYLAKRAVREQWGDAFEYEFTKEGVVYLATILVISIAALNTGNNLLFIIISAMVAAILISGIASAVTLRRLQVELSLPEQVFAEQPVIARVRMANHRAWPVFSVQVSTAEENRGRLQWRRTAFSFPPRRAKGKPWWTIADWKLERQRATSSQQSPRIHPVYFPYLPPGTTLQSDVELTFPRRGVYLQRALAVSTRFPFAFVKKTRKISLKREVLVLPSVNATGEWITRLPSLAGDYDSLIRGQGHDLYRFREHVPGDSARSVDWKATARAGRVMVREFTREDDQRVRIVFDNPLADRLREEEYERMVSAAASLTWQLSERAIPLELVAPEHHSTDAIEFLEYLAVVRPATKVGHLPEITEDAFTIVLTAGDWLQPGSRCYFVRYGSAAGAT